MSADSRALKLAVSILGRDVTSMKESNTRMFQGLEQNILYVNSNFEEKTDELKQSLGDVSSRLELNANSDASEVESLLAEAIADDQITAIVANCSEKISSLEDKMDSKLSSLSSHTEMILRRVSKAPLNGETVTPCKCDQSRTSSFIDNEMLYHALTNMTSNVVQSISFFRHTSSMLERIIENTDNVAYQQKKLRTDIVEIFSESNESSFTETAEDSYSEGFETAIEEGGLDSGVASQQSGGRKARPFESRASRVSTSGRCNVSESVLKGIAHFSKNGSQLLELLTELAQMSSVSIVASIDSLRTEVSRLGELFNEEQTFTSLAGPRGDDLLILKIANTTRATFRLTEAVASNTGWIPYIYHNVQFVETQLNKSMDISNLMLTELRKVRNKLPQSYGRMENVNSQHGAFNQVPRTPSAHSRKNRQFPQDLSNKEILQFIYETSIKLKRIMPALTRLVAEPGKNI